MHPSNESYTLNVGQRGATRLSLLQEIYGPTSQRWLIKSGLAAGANVLELACGTGNMTQWIAAQVGPHGRVTGVDSSPAQLEAARSNCAGLTNVELRAADAASTGLPPGSFDLVYLRCLLMHVPEPVSVLAHARTLLRPGGVLVCEEAAIDSTFTDPQVPEQRELHQLATDLAQQRGCDYNIARRLGSVVRASGFEPIELEAYVPIYTSGPCKTLEVESFREALIHWTSGSPELRAKGQRLYDALTAAAHDDTTIYGLSTMMRLRARSRSAQA